MTDLEFAAFLHLLMASDPSPLDDAEDKILTGWADAEARRHGYRDWIGAFHEEGKS